MPEPTDLTISSVDALCNAPDDQPMVVEGTLTRIEVRANQAGARWAELTVADPGDPEIVAKVQMPPAVYARYVGWLRVGEVVLVRGDTAVRTSLLACAMRYAADWDGPSDPLDDGPAEAGGQS